MESVLTAVEEVNMRWLIQKTRVFKAGLLTALTCFSLMGCAGSGDRDPRPVPGNGIAEYRQITEEAYRAVAATVGSLEGIAGQPKRSMTEFDRALHDLEVSSVKARARAEAIIARGENYFDEWKEQLAGAAPSERADYERLYHHFTLIRERSSEVRNEFRPFMASLRSFRAPLDQPAAPDVKEALAPDEIKSVTASGRRVLAALESVSTALNTAEKELYAQLHSKR